MKRDEFFSIGSDLEGQNIEFEENMGILWLVLEDMDGMGEDKMSKFGFHSSFLALSALYRNMKEQLERLQKIAKRAYEQGRTEVDFEV